jgi:predicted Rossmann fold nucleotide-binding protein DprA/Smf involved in DNA uptake
MERAAGEGVGSAEIFAMSLFVPVGTYVIGKVVGELLEQGKRERAQAPAAHEAAGVLPQEDLTGDPVFADLLRVLATPMPLREIYRTLPEYRDRLPEALRALERRGAVRNEGGLWVRSEMARR